MSRGIETGGVGDGSWGMEVVMGLGSGAGRMILVAGVSVAGRERSRLRSRGLAKSSFLRLARAALSVGF